jgi:hypothetical protein
LSVVPKCVIEGCTRRPHTRGLCHRHHEEERQRAKDAGDHSPDSKDRDRIDAAALILDRGLGRAPQAVFHGGPNQVGNMPTAVELLAEDAIATPLLTSAAARQSSDYEAELRRELRRIDAEREEARAAQEAELNAARAAKANGADLDGPMRMLLEVKDSN